MRGLSHMQAEAQTHTQTADSPPAGGPRVRTLTNPFLPP